VSDDLGGSVLVDVQVHDEGEWTIVSIVGELDLAVAPRVRHAVAEMLGTNRTERPQVILDLGSVHFVDSSGLGVALGILRRVRQAGGTMRAVVIEPQVVALFELLDLDTVFDLRPSLAEALADPVLAAPSSAIGTEVGPGGGSGG
jgi:anti-sigma B factor antagonist